MHDALLPRLLSTRSPRLPDTPEEFGQASTATVAHRSLHPLSASPDPSRPRSQAKAVVKRPSFESSCVLSIFLGIGKFAPLESGKPQSTQPCRRRLTTPFSCRCNFRPSFSTRQCATPGRTTTTGLASSPLPSPTT